MSVVHIDLHPTICEAIRSRRRLQFDYSGHTRIVEPYCHGRTSTGAEVLRAVQINGPEKGRGFGKLFTISKLEGVVQLGVEFEPSDPNYNPDDKALVFIHCRV